MNLRSAVILAAVLAMALLLASGGCATSANYKGLVAETYPRIAERMERYDLTPEESLEVSALRAVSADKAAVRYESARPAWEAVSPDYRRRVGLDEGLQQQRKQDWFKTADLLDLGQQKEQRYRQTLGVEKP